MSDRIAVLICGAGPTGLTLALELTRFGVPFRIVDRSFAPARYSQALAIQARTLELLEPTGVTQELTRHMHRVTHVRVQDGERTILELSFAGMPTCYDYVAVVPQRTTERIMLERLEERGIEVERGVTLTGLRSDDDGCEAALAHASGTERVRAGYVAACDGAHSTIRHRTGVPFAGHALAEAFMLADVELETPLPADRLSLFLGSDGGVLGLLPIDRRSWRVIVESPHGVPEAPVLRDVQRAIDGYGLRDTRATHASWLAQYHVHHRKIERYRHGRVLFLGDAAHIHSPIGGQGMNTGIQDAINLGWKLALVEREDVDPALLETYAEEREAVGRALLARTDFGNRVVLSVNPVVRGLRDALLPVATHLDPVRTRLRENIAQLRVGYPRSRLSVHGRTHHGGTVAGARLRGARPSGYSPRILVVPNDAQNASTTLVVRPDGYAGYVTDGMQHTGAETYLRHVVGLRELSARDVR